MTSIGKQIPLSIHFAKPPSFDNFVKGENTPLIASLMSALSNNAHERFFIWGSSGTGKTHLLQACIQALDKQSIVGYYFSGKNESISPEMLDGYESGAIICVDDVDCFAGNITWEQALFHLYNRALDANCLMVFAANTPLKDCDFELADLVSRLASCTNFRVHALTDNDKMSAIKNEAMELGLELQDEVCTYILTHYGRNLKELMQIIKRLDTAALSEMRRITIPFIKTVLN